MAKEVPSGTSFHLHKELSRRFSMQDEAEQKATILTHFYPEVTVEKMSSLVLEYIGRSSKCYHIGTGNVVYCAYVKKNVFYKSVFEEKTVCGFGGLF